VNVYVDGGDAPALDDPVGPDAEDPHRRRYRRRRAGPMTRA